MMTKAERRDFDWEVAREQQRARMVDALASRPGRLKQKAEVWMFDLDGTLACVNQRDPLDARSCDEDPPNVAVVALARAIQAAGYGLVFASGRKEEHRAKTHAWLMWQAHLPEYLKLVMRPQRDHRPDFVVKRELYEAEIAPYFDVVAVVDDRTSVVKMWRGLGLTCFQVDDRVA